jgi:hypothetical protein
MEGLSVCRDCGRKNGDKMRIYPRKTAPQVVRGEVRKKNRWTPSENRYDAPRPREVVVDRERPGEGYRHVLTKKDVYDFLSLLPDWDKLAVGLNAVVLAVCRRVCPQT